MSFSSNRVYLYSLSRSGSTLLWQVLRYLLPDHRINKRHHPPAEVLAEEQVPVIVTLRDPRDRVASLYRKMRTGTVALTNRKLLNRLLENNQLHFKELDQYLKAHWSDCLVLPYSSFYENFDWLLDQLAAYLHITVTAEQRQYVRDNFNVNKNLEVASTMKSFHDINYETFIHGNHISPLYKGMPCCWTKIIDPSLHKFYCKELKGQMQQYLRWERETLAAAVAVSPTECNDSECGDEQHSEQ